MKIQLWKDWSELSYDKGTCVASLTDHTRKEVDQGKLCGLVLFDLQKAFDTVDNEIRLYKLETVGFFAAAIKRVQSSLTDIKRWM